MKYKKKFKIGDRIKVIAPGQIYSTFKDMAKFLGADVGGKWKPRSVSEGDNTLKITGHVLNISDDDHILIELDNGQQWIISPAGLKKKDIILLPEELFEI